MNAPRSLLVTPALMGLGASTVGFVKWWILRASTPVADISLTFTGWLSLLFLAATVVIIVHSAINTYPHILTGYLFLALGFAVAIVCIGLFSNLITVGEAFAVGMLLSAWLACWCGISTLLRRISPAFSVATSMALAMFFFAGPVSTLPLLRIASANSPAQHLLVQSVSTMTPMLAALDAIQGSIPLQWTQLPQMYHLTTAGQDFPMPLPTWWSSTLVYATLALASLLLAKVVKVSHAW